jgi:hypothetical protein
MAKNREADIRFMLLTSNAPGGNAIWVDSFDTAINWAARIPNARTGTIEVRPVMDLDW